MIKVYSVPGCAQCRATQQAFQRANIPIQTVDLAVDPISLARLRDDGFTAAPVVETPTARWQGFRPDLIRQAILSQRALSPSMTITTERPMSL